MRILFLIDSLRSGGAERQMVELVKGLIGNGHEIHLICLEKAHQGYSEILESIGIAPAYCTRSNRFDLLGPVLGIADYISKKNIELVHTFNNLGSLAGALAAKWRRKPVVCSAIRDGKDKGWKYKYSVLMLDRIADVLVANSQAGFASRFSSMKPHRRVVYNGVDFSRFDCANGDATIAREEIGLERFSHLIGMTATLSTFKDHDTFIESVPAVLREFPNAGFLCIGDGPRRGALQRKVRSLGLDGQVLFLGFRADVDQIQRVLDVSVLLSNADLHEEGISNSLLEAMALGIPVVASRGGGTEELVRHGDTGILVTPKSSNETSDAILNLLHDDKKRNNMGLAARLYVRKQFNLQKYCSEYEMIYNFLVKG
jgi:glycosyltransferase involved in cell wall biosynthesis